MSRYDRYPYIQNESSKQGVCEVCKKEKTVRHIEWRVDWFQGNCEFEDICHSCFDKRKNEAKKRQQEHQKKMAPIWKRQREKREAKITNTKKIIENSGLSLKTFDNGQWTIANTLDWWTTTGTAIERKTRERYYIKMGDTQKLKAVLTNLNDNPPRH